MTNQERLALILRSKEKNEIIRGYFIDLYPYVPGHSEAIVRLRNQEKSFYYMNQKRVSEVNSQYKWYNIYFLRNNDIYWCICKKQGEVVGC